jgi:transcriptional regulator with XRE-family HTH domain
MLVMADDRKYKQALSNTLKALRGARTQKEVAAAAGIPTSTWCKIEQGRQLPRDLTFARIAEALARSVPELEQIVSRSILSELAGAPASGSTLSRGPAGDHRGGQEALDLTGVPESAAQRLATTLGTIGALHRQLDGLELDIHSLCREFQALAQGDEQ